MNEGTPQAQEAQNDADMMSGGLPDMTVTTQQTETPPEAAAPAAPVETKKYIVGNREFGTAEEAIAYANGIAAVQGPAVAAQAVQQPQAPEEPKLAQLLFEDPERAAEIIKQKTIKEWEDKQRAVERDKKLWDDFYSRHPDLKGREILVDAVLSREQTRGTFNGLSLDQQAQLLATRTRDELRRISNVQSGGQALPSKPAMVAGSSGASAPPAPAPKAQPTDFVTELKSMRKRS